MEPRRSPWRRRLRTILLALAVLSAAWAAVRFWIAPAVIRRALVADLPEYWDGELAIDRVRFGLCGHVRLDGVDLRGPRGRSWMRADTVHLTLSDWPSLHPKVRGVEADAPAVTAHCTGGVCRPPWRKVPAELWREYLDLHEAELRDATLTVRDDANTAGTWHAARLRFLREPGAGRVTVWTPWHDGLAVEDVTVEGFEADERTVAVERLTGRACGGRFLLSFRSRVGADGGLAASGRVAGVRLDLANANLPVAGAGTGRLTGVVTFELDGVAPDGFTGRGMAFIREADLRNVPAARGIFAKAGVGSPQLLRRADVEAAFGLRGLTATVDHARVALPVGAVDVEPGGTLSLWDGRMEYVVVVVLFEKVRGLLKSIPLVGMMVDLTERFSRFHIAGLWQDPDSLVITPAPLREVQDASRTFLTAAARGRGALGAAARQSARALLAIEDPDAPPTRPATARTRPATAPALR